VGSVAAAAATGGAASMAASSSRGAASVAASDAGRTTVPIDVAEVRFVTHNGSAGERAAGSSVDGSDVPGAPDPIRCATSDSVNDGVGSSASRGSAVGSPRMRRSRYIPID